MSNANLILGENKKFLNLNINDLICNDLTINGALVIDDITLNSITFTQANGGDINCTDIICDTINPTVSAGQLFTRDNIRWTIGLFVQNSADIRLRKFGTMVFLQMNAHSQSTGTSTLTFGRTLDFDIPSSCRPSTNLKFSVPVETGGIKKLTTFEILTNGNMNMYQDPDETQQIPNNSTFAWERLHVSWILESAP